MDAAPAFRSELMVRVVTPKSVVVPVWLILSTAVPAVRAFVEYM